VGDWLSQLNAVVMPPGLSLDARELVRSCGLRGWDFEYLPASLPQFKPYHRTRDVFSFMDLSRGYGAYAAERCRSGTQQIKSIVTLERKFERDVGPLKFEFHTREPRVLDALMDWRFDKYGSRGTSDVRRDPWAWTLVQRLHGLQSADFAGVLSVLSANGRPIAAHMGMRSRTVLQYWLPAYDPACARYSPGLILLLRMAQQAPAAGLRTIDLGGGQFPYKKRLMSGQYDVAGGSVGMPGLATAGSRLRRLAYEWVRKSKVLRPPAIAVAQGIDQLVRVFK
jgi:CelD/BcsL family acetyltransferase involved in cellulose biosynthesis